MLRKWMVFLIVLAEFSLAIMPLATVQAKNPNQSHKTTTHIPFPQYRPDVSLHGLRGISAQDSHSIQNVASTTSNWLQVNANGFGDAKNEAGISMAVFNNQLYAGAGNWSGVGASIWRTSDGLNWSPAVTGGFGDPSNNAAITSMIAFKGQLYAGAGWGGLPHSTIGQLWRSPDGTTWNQITGNGLGVSSGPIVSQTIYGDTLYVGTCAGTSGTQIWRSSVGDSSSWTIVATINGPTTSYVCVSSLKEFNGYLYASVGNMLSGAQIWRSAMGDSGSWTQVNMNGFGDGSDLAGWLAIYKGYLYVGTRGPAGTAELWRSSDGTTWNSVITNGFGDFYNWEVPTLYTFNGLLYAGLNNDTTGAEVWRFDGTSWNQTNQDGFGDFNNGATNGMIAFNNSLYTGTSNYVPTGLEIWKLLPVFADVSSTYWASSFIERLYNAGITGGCSSNPLMYCPGSVVTRDQMAVFLLKGKHGANYVPPAATGMFADVPQNYWAAAWIEQLAVEGVTAGCGGGNYCATTPVTRDQMAVFLLKAKYGSSYVPPLATGDFADVPQSYWAAAWIEELAVEGVTGGCNTNPPQYCPGTEVTRDQMAVFLVKNFNLP